MHCGKKEEFRYSQEWSTFSKTKGEEIWRLSQESLRKNHQDKKLLQKIKTLGKKMEQCRVDMIKNHEKKLAELARINY